MFVCNSMFLFLRIWGELLWHCNSTLLTWTFCPEEEATTSSKVVLFLKSFGLSYFVLLCTHCLLGRRMQLKRHVSGDKLLKQLNAKSIFLQLNFTSFFLLPFYQIQQKIKYKSLFNDKYEVFSTMLIICFEAI